MAASPQRLKRPGLDNAEWALLLSRCIDSIDSENFSANLVELLGSIVPFDYSVSFAYHQNEKPLCLYHSFSPVKQIVFVDEYLKGPYLLDPFFKACGQKVDTGLYRMRDVAPDRFYQSEYYRSYYIQTGLAEEIAYTMYFQDGVAVVISLMRAGDSSRFSAREFRLLDNLVPIVDSLSQRHWCDLHNRFESKSSDPENGFNRSIIEDMVSVMFGPRITPREIQVVAQILEGHSSESIARSLGIAVGTVRIHRRNVYAKLQISSQQELFSIFSQKFKTAGK